MSNTTLLALVALLALYALVGNPNVTTTLGGSNPAKAATPNRECRTVEYRSFFQIRCSYDRKNNVWQLKYSGPAYKMTRDSGRHQELLEFLCRHGGRAVNEKHDGKETNHECIKKSN